jgi:hypothetical protein
MKALFIAAALAVAVAAPCRAAEEVKPPDLSPPDTWLPVQQGSIRIMNKIDSTVQTVPLKVGQTATYQSLSVTLTGCFVRPQDLPADAAARLQIVDHRPDSPAFNGWMLKREPSLNLYEHPVYDVQLAGCG